MRRERHNLSLLTAFASSAVNPTNVRRPSCTKSSGLAQLWKSTFFWGRNSTHCFFSKLNPRFRCMTSPKYPIHNSYLGFFFCAWTPTLMLHLTNPRAKRKVLSLIKPKGKIYKMQSLHNHVTNLPVCKQIIINKYSCDNKFGNGTTINIWLIFTWKKMQVRLLNFRKIYLEHICVYYRVER